MDWHHNYMSAAQEEQLRRIVSKTWMKRGNEDISGVVVILSVTPGLRLSGVLNAGDVLILKAYAVNQRALHHRFLVLLCTRTQGGYDGGRAPVNSREHKMWMVERSMEMCRMATVVRWAPLQACGSGQNRSL
uniref:Uncharacterized protein n=1 Tax=Eutreptiella gymnastica TaxID=73025 RepID=A0A7S1J5L9_9EUGL